MLWLQGICSMPNALCWNNKIYQSEPSRNSFICRIKVIATDALVGPETNKKKTSSKQLSLNNSALKHYTLLESSHVVFQIGVKSIMLSWLLGFALVNWTHYCTECVRYRGAARGYWGQRWSVQVAFQLACWAAISEGFSFSRRSKPTEPTWVETKGLMSLLNN